MKVEIEIKVPESKRKEILSSITVLVDSREKSNTHILSWFENNNIKYKIQKLEVGDYSFELPANEFWANDIQFTNHIIIERKNSLEELSGNFANDRMRFENELAEIYDQGLKMFLIIEGTNLQSMILGEYNTQYNRNAFTSSFITFMLRYGFSPIFVPKDYAGFMIFNIFKYFLHDKLK